MQFFNTVEFYVILAVVAAAILALASRPDSLAPVKELLMACRLEDEAEHSAASVEMECQPNGLISIARRGVADICDGGAVSLAIKIKGRDMLIEERITQGRGLMRPSVSASCLLPFIRLERYHVVYNSSSTGQYVAFTFPAKPGIKVLRSLHS